MTTDLPTEAKSREESERGGPRGHSVISSREARRDPQTGAPGSQLQEALPTSPAELRGREQSLHASQVSHRELGDASLLLG